MATLRHTHLRILAVVTACLLLAGLSACGNKGPLKRPSPSPTHQAE